jgi:hypothetical protein
MTKIKSNARTLNQIKEESFHQRVIRRISKISNSKRLIEESKKFSTMVLRGLAADFRKINNSLLLQERGKRVKGGGGKNIDLSATMKALGDIKDPKVNDILSRELESLLTTNGIKVPKGSIKAGASPIVKAQIKPKDEVATAPEGKTTSDADKETKKEKNGEPPAVVGGAAETTAASKTVVPAAAATNRTAEKNETMQLAAPATAAAPAAAPAPAPAPATVRQGSGITQVRQRVKQLGESIKRKYRLGLITLREYNVKKTKIR